MKENTVFIIITVFFSLSIALLLIIGFQGFILFSSVKELEIFYPVFFGIIFFGVVLLVLGEFYTYKLIYGW